MSIELQGRLRVLHFKQSFSDSSVLLFLEIEIESCPKTFFKEALEAPEKPQGYLAVNNNYQQLPNKDFPQMPQMEFFVR